MKVSISQFFAAIIASLIPQKSNRKNFITGSAVASTSNSDRFITVKGVQQISYFIDPALANPNNTHTDWSPAIFNAIVDYKNLLNRSVVFVAAPNSSQADLSFVLNGSKSDFAGSDGYPNEGKFNKCIRLLGNNLPSINKERIALHELGHALGQRSTYC